MTQSQDRLQNVFAAIDTANSRDPSYDSDQPAALLYGRRMTAQLSQFQPDSSIVLQIAVRGQHIERWSLSRNNFPTGRAGYLSWRNALKDVHAHALTQIMETAGYDAASIARVRQIVRKENFKTDQEAQTLEDVACLVFLEFYADAFFSRHGVDKSVDILRKTWRKMSPAGQNAAQTIHLTQECADLMARALACTPAH